jgi:hypothetical protein
MRLLTAFLVFGSTGLAQTVHQVPADTKGNQIILTVEGRNEPGTPTVVEVVRKPRVVSFT